MAGFEEALPSSGADFSTFVLGWKGSQTDYFWRESSTSSTTRRRTKNVVEGGEGEELKGTFQVQAPGFVKEVAIQLRMQVWKDPINLMAMSWSEHVQRGHTPFRRNCQICQELQHRGENMLA